MDPGRKGGRDGDDTLRFLAAKRVEYDLYKALFTFFKGDIMGKKINKNTDVYTAWFTLPL